MKNVERKLSQTFDPTILRGSSIVADSNDDGVQGKSQDDSHSRTDRVSMKSRNGVSKRSHRSKQNKSGNESQLVAVEQ